MVVNFVLAIGLVHLGDSYPNAFPAIIVLTGSGYPALLAWESQASGQHAQDGRICPVNPGKRITFREADSSGRVY